MDEVRYQLDLLKAMNQKLKVREQMYENICGSLPCAFLYFTFEDNKISAFGKWRDYFDFDISSFKDLPKILNAVSEDYSDKLRDLLFLEKLNESEKKLVVMLKDKKTYLSFKCNVSYVNDLPDVKTIVIENVTKIENQKEELYFASYFDWMTGLYNRNYFVSLLTNMLEKAKESNLIVSLMVIDIDDFKKVNDGRGIILGDVLIQTFGEFLKSFQNEDTIVCHLNDDAYCIAILDPCGNKSVQAIHKAIQKRTKEPFILSDKDEVNITVSIGVAEFPECADNALNLINCAEIVMFKGKSIGKNTIMYFDTPILNEFLQNVEIENKLRDAIYNEKFEMYFQPQVCSKNKKLRGVEALIRWKDESNFYCSPSVFIPIAEKNGTIIPIGNFVVEESIKKYSFWKEKYHIDFILSINISSLQYKREDFADSLLRTIEKYNVNPSNIELEITESVLIDDFKAVSDKLRFLREYGIRVSLDDFGTGFSSLSYLKKLPIDTLKIDKSFVDTCLIDPATKVITESIVNMVKMLGFESIAEGVEEKNQFEYLKGIGCDVIQGYYFGKPMSSKELCDIFEANKGE